MIWWKKSIDKFINFMDEYLSLTNIVVNVPYFNDQILYSNGKIEKYKEDNVQRYNEIYHEMVDYFSMRRNKSSNIGFKAKVLYRSRIHIWGSMDCTLS